MEKELAAHLLALGERYAGARGFALATVGRLVAADSRFFERLTDGKTFTARKYDEVIQWFSDNWPEKTRWPAGVRRPPKSGSAESAA